MSGDPDLTLPGNLVDDDWLHERLDHPGLRVVDATVAGGAGAPWHR